MNRKGSFYQVVTEVLLMKFILSGMRYSERAFKGTTKTYGTCPEWR